MSDHKYLIVKDVEVMDNEICLYFQAGEVVDPPGQYDNVEFPRDSYVVLRGLQGVEFRWNRDVDYANGFSVKKGETGVILDPHGEWGIWIEYPYEYFHLFENELDLKTIKPGDEYESIAFRDTRYAFLCHYYAAKWDHFEKWDYDLHKLIASAGSQFDYKASMDQWHEDLNVYFAKLKEEENIWMFSGNPMEKTQAAIRWFRNERDQAYAKLGAFAEDVVIAVRAIQLTARMGHGGTHREKDQILDVLHNLCGEVYRMIQTDRSHGFRNVGGYFSEKDWDTRRVIANHHRLERQLEKIKKKLAEEGKTIEDVLDDKKDPDFVPEEEIPF